jgi:hypothetical protein
LSKGKTTQATQSQDLLSTLTENYTNHGTILHKLTARNPEVLKSYLEAIKRHWPQLHIPHLLDAYGCTPLKRALK